MKTNRGIGYTRVLAVLGWLITLLGGLLDIYVAQFIAISFYARFLMGGKQFANPDEIALSNSIRIATVFVAAMIYVVFLIVTTEYHIKHFGKTGSWQLLAKTIAVELLIIVVAYITGPVTW
jgi:hypothetical protein